MITLPRRILMVRTSALGDVARTVPALVQLKAAYPQATIDWLVHEQYAEVIAAHPDLHEPIGFPRKRLAAMPGLIMRLRNARYDLAIDLEGQARSALLTYFSGAPRRIGYANAREGARLAYTQSTYVSPTVHAVNRMLTLLHATNLTPRTAAADLTLHVPADALTWHTENLAQSGKGYIAIAPTARWRSKCWPITHFIDIAKRLRNQGHRIVVLAAPNERALVQPLVDAAEADCPTTTVAQLMATIARAKLLLCHDSAALHIAVGLRTPAVALFGPTDPMLVGPYQQPYAVIQPPGIGQQDVANYRSHRDDQTLISRITPERVWQHLQTMLA